ncbi:hypothetical protein SAMN05421738_11745 [Algoriella xinjiangensis]|uniref:Uncharacterized protein n=2 Tax=Algoriella xinjiangensis TaxID=684065 RepID=A0A1I5AL79_9FLAO|nr:hypothetical protein SAMN05421738_11745 [Algoriella xinjiangensis]VDH16287.1 Uncharacterised protein [Algoriella xinjiangensis]
MPMNINERISTSDFIAKAKIKKIWLDDKNKSLHNIEIEIIDLYKGVSTKRMKIYSEQMTSCAFFTPQNTTWLIFASKDKDGILKFGFCSGSIKIENNIASIQRKIELLKYMKTEKIDMNTKNNVSYVINSEFLKKFNGLKELQNNFALYEVTINKDLSVNFVRAIKEFSSESINIELLEILKLKSKVYAKNREMTILQQEKIIIPIFYYPKEKNESSFISPYDL